ncbi:FeoB-associated Cys-rich membrane protein [Desulfopila sp. IMCC35006]|uniref:FeoB-associated Cys-rich membrane protein n=1 Tax=Desulfopila sp. IMCC35006 TaxID=2569542 RepID=UPI0010AB9E61|nr:FeoB-associated Cys-rich membrane protein [Desulfopila sp. IMCC35006]
MLETIIIWTIIAICAFFTGRRFYRQWKIATSKDSNISCGQSCTCCSDSSCSSRKKSEDNR